MRPGSSAGASSRPSTSQSNYRPISRLSHISQRPASSASTHRPSSRLSGRPTSKHAARFVVHIRTLVAQLTGITENDDEDLLEACDSAARTLETHRYTGLSADIKEVDTKIDGFVEKAQIKGQATLADALLETRRLLKTAVANDARHDDRLINPNLLPQHIQLLLLLTATPSAATQTAAVNILEHIRNPPGPPQELTWADILAEEPLEGQHWEMNSVGGSTSSDEYSDTPKYESDEASTVDDPTLSSLALLEVQENDEISILEAEVQDAKRLEALDTIRKRQYWTRSYESLVKADVPFKLGDPMTLGPALASLERKKSAFSSLSNPTYLSEIFAVREVLMALQCISSCLFAIDEESTVTVASRGPILAHVSPGAYHSILDWFAGLATTHRQLRNIVKIVYTFESHQPLTAVKRPRCRTLLAYAEGTEILLNDFGLWCSQKEEQVGAALRGSKTPTVVTLLNLKNEVDAQISSVLHALLSIWTQISVADPSINTSFNTAPTALAAVHPAILTKRILDALLLSSQAHLAMGDAATVVSLNRVFVHTVGPVWTYIQRWLKGGAVIDDSLPQGPDTVTDPEFFIETSSSLMNVGEPWETACRLRSSPRGELTPEFLGSNGQQVLSAGKAVGLLRALGIEDFFYDQAEPTWIANWASTGTIFGQQTRDQPSIADGLPEDGVSDLPAAAARQVLYDVDKKLSEASLQALIYRAQEYLIPLCQVAQARLSRVLFEDCHLFAHLESIEDVFLMGRGDIITQFCEALFARMDGKRSWSDYHFLNGALRDVIAASSCPWIDSSLLRISAQTSARLKISRSVRALEGVSLEYQVPFPLNYVLSPDAVRAYSSIFVFLLQIRRAKNVIDSMILKGIIQSSSHITPEELKAFYALRGKMSWFVNTLTSYIMTYVLHVNVLALHEAFERASALDTLIAAHQQHLSTIRSLCLLDQEHAHLHRSILTILDMCLTFSDTFTALTADTSVDISRMSLVALRDVRRSGTGRPRRRLRKSQKRLRQNQMPLTMDAVSSVFSEEDDSDSSDDFQMPDMDDDEMDFGEGISFIEESFLSRIETMTTRLDDMVRFLQRGVETAANAAGDSAFSVLSFTLEDWDR